MCLKAGCPADVHVLDRWDFAGCEGVRVEWGGGRGEMAMLLAVNT